MINFHNHVMLSARNLDLSKFCIGQKDEMQQPPIYDLYAVINHYGGMIGGHYTAYARLPSDKNSQRSDVGESEIWALFRSSTVGTSDRFFLVWCYFQLPVNLALCFSSLFTCHFFSLSFLCGPFPFSPIHLPSLFGTAMLPTSLCFFVHPSCPPGWRLFDDSTVTMVEESQVVTRYAYVLFYRRRNSPVERPPRFLSPLRAESPTVAGAAASQVRVPLC